MSPLGRDGGDYPSPAKTYRLRLHAVPDDAIETQGQRRTFHLDPQLPGTSDGEKIEGASRSARLVHQLEAISCKMTRHLLFGFIADHGRRDDRPARASPPQPQPECGVCKPIGAIIISKVAK